MLTVFLLVAIIVLASTSLGCPGDDHDHAHTHSRRAFPQVNLPAPTRPLTWGDVNIIHTTDTHGWLLGHQKLTEPEPNYSGDLGDFASFVAHMKKLAVEKDVDLLLVDSGDVHDGTGLSDGFPAGQVDAHASNQFIKQLPYDILAIGNHELYDYANTFDMYTDFAPFWKGRYLSSNVNITIFGEHNTTISVPVGERFAKFTTRKGRKITSLGVLYDFTGNSENTTVQKVADMVKEEWFLGAIKEEPDFFLLVGHMPVSQDNWPLVFNAVRAVHPTTPILIFGGHTHIRDCVQLDGRSMALESGRYMETIGWMSVDLDEKSRDKAKNLTFTRRYLDQNRVGYEFHSEQTNRTFDTAHGKGISSGLLALAEKFDLDHIFGVSPSDFFLDSAPYPSNSSVLSLLISSAAPTALAINNTRAATHPHIILTNSGELRFSVFAGPFTKNDQFTALPFADSFLFIPDVPFDIANAVLPALNEEGADQKKREVSPQKREHELYERGDVSTIYRAWLRSMAEASDAYAFYERSESPSHPSLTPGYVTSDGCPGIGDDIPHTALPFFSAPDFIGSLTVPDNTTNSSPSGSDPIDLVFINFIADQVIETLNDASASMGGRTNYTESDVQSYTPILANQILELFASAAWNS